MTVVRPTRYFLAILLGFTLGSIDAPCRAGVVVISNRTTSKAEYSIVQADGSRQRHEIVPYASDALPTAETLTLEITEDGESRQFKAQANSIQYLHRPADKLLLAPVNLPDVDLSRMPAPRFPAGKRNRSRPGKQ